jgi:hypothetical protein
MSGGLTMTLQEQYGDRVLSDAELWEKVRTLDAEGYQPLGALASAPLSSTFMRMGRHFSVLWLPKDKGYVLFPNDTPWPVGGLYDPAAMFARKGA